MAIWREGEEGEGGDDVVVILDLMEVDDTGHCRRGIPVLLPMQPISRGGGALKLADGENLQERRWRRTLPPVALELESRRPREESGRACIDQAGRECRESSFTAMVCVRCWEREEKEEI